jgi:YidC/Oxa1 family membrane protein insertase
MSSEKRVILFTIVTFASILAIEYVMRATGLTPPPEKPAANAVVKADAKKDLAKADAPGKPRPDVAAKDQGKTAEKPPAEKKPGDKAPRVALADLQELTLGSVKNEGPAGYHLQVMFDQKGAGVASVSTGLYEAEFEEGKPRHRPLEIVGSDPLTPSSLTFTLLPKRPPGAPAAPAAPAAPDAPDAPEQAKAAGLTMSAGEIPLDGVVWEVDRDAGKAVRTGTLKDPQTGAVVEYQEIRFKTEVEGLGLTVHKTYRLLKAADAFTMEVTFSSPEKTSQVAYKLLGPHGLPIEGAWYTGTFRDAVFGQINGNSTKVDTIAAYDVVKSQASRVPFQNLPLKFAGVENQYFVAFVAPKPTPTSDEARWDSEFIPVVLHEDAESKQKSDIGVQILSRPLTVGPNAAQTHTYLVYAGPKTREALTPYAAEDLATYRKGYTFWGASTFVAQYLINPLLKFTYELTRRVAALFGSSRGNYGVAIILMTMLVRLAMFPLGRKQAMAAKKMQDLQPHLKEIQAKFKDDKEALTREQFALYKRHGVNPMGGCLPALIQLPIFVGLWQALNNSVYLRHAAFLWINNLAAPDMLFKFPGELPFVGKYFNLLPFLVVALMLVQTKLFSPPATTPEAEMQQKMMKYMMVFMAFMFYKVPSGLGIYFITSSLWQVCERLLLPKVSTAPPAQASDDGKPPRGGGGGGTSPAPAKPPGPFARFFEKLMNEASKDPTYRKMVDDKKKKDGNADSGDRNRDRDRGKPRARPGRRR